jgi:hypothetical protein
LYTGRDITVPTTFNSIVGRVATNGRVVNIRSHTCPTEWEKSLGLKDCGILCVPVFDPLEVAAAATATANGMASTSSDSSKELKISDLYKNTAEFSARGIVRPIAVVQIAGRIFSNKDQHLLINCLATIHQALRTTSSKGRTNRIDSGQQSPMIGEAMSMIGDVCGAGNDQQRNKRPTQQPMRRVGSDRDMLLESVQAIVPNEWESSADLCNKLCWSALNVIAKCLGAEWCALYEVDKDRQQLFTCLADGSLMRVPMEGSVAGFVVKTGEKYNLASASEDSKDQHDFSGGLSGSLTSAKEENVCSMLCYPLLNLEQQGDVLEQPHNHQAQASAPVVGEQCAGKWGQLPTLPSPEILGVCQLVNKRDRDGLLVHFDAHDEDLLEKCCHHIGRSLCKLR